MLRCYGYALAFTALCTARLPSQHLEQISTFVIVLSVTLAYDINGDLLFTSSAKLSVSQLLRTSTQPLPASMGELVGDACVIEAGYQHRFD